MKKKMYKENEGPDLSRKVVIQIAVDSDEDPSNRNGRIELDSVSEIVMSCYAIGSNFES